MHILRSLQASTSYVPEGQDVVTPVSYVQFSAGCAAASQECGEGQQNSRVEKNDSSEHSSIFSNPLPQPTPHFSS